MKKILSFLLILILCGAMFVGCQKPKDKEMTKVRVNEVTHSIFYSPFYLAIEKGFFKENNIEIELTNGGGSNVSMTAVLSGSADVGLVGPETAVYVFNEGKQDYPVIFGQLTQKDGSFLIGRSAETNFDYKNLEGKEILAGRKGGLPAMTLEYVLNKQGLVNGKNITLNYDVAFNMMAGAFEGKVGDYTTLFEPTASDFVAAGKGHMIASIGKDSGLVPYTCFVATTSFLNDNSDLAVRFLKSVYTAIDYMTKTDSLEVAKALLPQFPGTDVNSIKNSVESYLEIDAWNLDLTMTEDSFIRLQDIMFNAKMLDKRAQYTKLVNNTYAKNAKK